jgi:hypothetical protein
MHTRITSKENEVEIEKFSKKLEVLYEFLDWHWRDNEETPMAKEIKENIMYLLKDMKGSDKISCGGITIERDEFGYDIYFSKEFHTYIE